MRCFSRATVARTVPAEEFLSEFKNKTRFAPRAQASKQNLQRPLESSLNAKAASRTDPSGILLTFFSLWFVRQGTDPSGNCSLEFLSKSFCDVTADAALKGKESGGQQSLNTHTMH